ncbi:MULTISPECIES: hypothetical protein [Bacillus]|uniref:hypothetical protein n=1 Tax=Bacillus TaxID=1386 RepID=UPI00036A385B|nr:MULTISPECIES: hypothetical protein [Bacillus]
MIEEIIYVLKMLFGYFWCIQPASVTLFLFFEWAMVDYYKLGTFENPETIFDKITNFFMKLFLGSGYVIYSKFSKHNWFVRKFYMLVALVVQGIVSIIIYFIITLPLDLIFK